MSISKKLRFEIFKRDNFKCQYCGRSTPNVILEIDHIKPKSKNGKNDINNLITACFDCNRGKSNIELTKIPYSLKENLDIMIEKENQYKQYQKFLISIDKRINNEIEKINILYNSMFNEYCLSENFKINTVKYFLQKLGFQEVYEAMRRSILKLDSDNSLKYFCGICHNKIREKL